MCAKWLARTGRRTNHATPGGLPATDHGPQPKGSSPRRANGQNVGEATLISRVPRRCLDRCVVAQHLHGLPPPSTPPTQDRASKRREPAGNMSVQSLNRTNAELPQRRARGATGTCAPACGDTEPPDVVKLASQAHVLAQSPHLQPGDREIFPDLAQRC